MLFVQINRKRKKELIFKLKLIVTGDLHEPLLSIILKYKVENKCNSNSKLISLKLYSLNAPFAPNRLIS